MAHGQTWRATVTYARPDIITEDQYEGLVLALTGYGIVDAGEEYLTLKLDVAGPTLRQATDVALRVAREAYHTAFATHGDQLAVRVITEAAELEELRRPRVLDLVGAAEAGEILGVARQRVDQLADAHEDFPDPVATIGGRRIYTRASIVEFDRHWDRRRTGRPPKA